MANKQNEYLKNDYLSLISYISIWNRNNSLFLKKYISFILRILNQENKFFMNFLRINHVKKDKNNDNVVNNNPNQMVSQIVYW